MLARAVELDPNVLAARRLLSEVHVQLGEYEYAVENGRVYIASLPEGEVDVEIRVLVAQSLMRLGRTEEAAETLAPLPDENPSVDLLYARGRILLAQQELEPARELLLAANEMKPNNPRLLSSLYAIDRVTGKTSHSIKRINDAIEADPEVSGLWYLKGLVALEVGDQDGAEKSFKKSIDLDPNRLDAYQQLAALYQSTGRGDEMLTIYEQAIEAQPESAPSHHFLGVLYEMRGRTDDAKEQYELAIQYDPSLGESKNNLAYLLAERGEDLDTALKLAQEAKAAMPDSANAADTLGWVLYKRGVSSAAIGYLREALQVSDPDEPGRGEILNHLAMAYEAAGQNDKAVESLEAAVAGYERLKESGRMSREPAWLSTARTSIDRLKSAG
jgi:tetratricopeptide (TPR) repeat protein